MLVFKVFLYSCQHYLQVEGLALGSPNSLITADMVRQRAIKSVMKNCPLRIYFIKKKDDLLLAVHVDDVDLVLGYFNAYHHKIQFTMKKEVDGCLPFLDLTIHRNPNNSMVTT